MGMIIHPLSAILSPSSIAIIGASNDAKKRGSQAIRQLLGDSFKGNIYPINPKQTEIAGLPCYSSLFEVENPIDLALICTPAETIPSVIEQCGLKGVKGAVVLAGGFSEAGEQGLKLENEMLAAARKYGVRLIGPNTSGFFNRHIDCNLVGFNQLPKGNIGILSQSGNMALSLVTEGTSNGHIGFSTYVGVGNEADISFHEYLDYFKQDPQTDVLVAYVEGLKQGREFLEAAKKTTLKKPIVLYKSGRTEKGQQAAKSHTGALAGSYGVSRQVMKQAGITVVSESDLILPTAEALSLLNPPKSRRLAILADGGGHATIAADVLTDLGIDLPELSEKTQQKLKTLLPLQATTVNPVDVAGATDSNPTRFIDCARAILADPAVDGLLVVGLFGGYHLRFDISLKEDEEQTAEAFGELLKEFGKPIMLQSVYESCQTEALIKLRKQGIPTYSSIETAVKCYSALAEYGQFLSATKQLSNTQHKVDSQEGENIVKKAHNEERLSLFEHEAKALLACHGVSIEPQLVASNIDELTSIAKTFNNSPVAMKVVSKNILHKSDAGAVKLNIMGAEAMKKAFEKIISNANNYDPKAVIEGVLMTPMAKPGVEVIIGIVNDPQFGPVMMFGLGGVYVEVLKDVVFRALPLTQIDAAQMLNQIKAHAILNGARGEAPIDKQALIQLMMQVSDLFLQYPTMSEIDLNPVIAYPEGYSVADARMILTT